MLLKPTVLLVSVFSLLYKLSLSVTLPFWWINVFIKLAISSAFERTLIYCIVSTVWSKWLLAYRVGNIKPLLTLCEWFFVLFIIKLRPAAVTGSDHLRRSVAVFHAVASPTLTSQADPSLSTCRSHLERVYLSFSSTQWLLQPSGSGWAFSCLWRTRSSSYHFLPFTLLLWGFQTLV